jgi:hypothetical protein
MPFDITKKSGSCSVKQRIQSFVSVAQHSPLDGKRTKNVRPDRELNTNLNINFKYPL